MFRRTSQFDRNKVDSISKKGNCQPVRLPKNPRASVSVSPCGVAAVVLSGLDETQHPKSEIAQSE